MLFSFASTNKKDNKKKDIQIQLATSSNLRKPAAEVICFRLSSKEPLSGASSPLVQRTECAAPRCAIKPTVEGWFRIPNLAPKLGK